VRITVRLFASLRERVGQETIYLDLDEAYTVADAWTQLCIYDSQLTAFRGQSLMALNRRYVRMNEPLSDGDELALFPPVSGG
jgi:molybdopterin converting factor subunit 1